jgi:hypothetical protein
MGLNTPGSLPAGRKIGYNPALKANRNKNGETLTQAVFGDTTPKTAKHTARMNIETAVKESQSDYILGNGKAGRVVPYHPKDWKKGNSVFNEFFDKKESANAKKKAVGGARPTSGKHYSRHFDADSVSQFLHKATQPPENVPSPGDDGDARSVIATNYEGYRKVEDLLSKLNDYLNGAKLEEEDGSLPPIQAPSTQMDSNSVVNTLFAQPIPEIIEEDDEYKTTIPLYPRSKSGSPKSPSAYQSQHVELEHVCSEDEEEHNCCGDVHHRFHSHARIHQTKADKIKLLNSNRKIS